MLDLVEDADGYNIAIQLRGNLDLAISDAVKQDYVLGRAVTARASTTFTTSACRCP
jgi:hypothetical protein